VPADYGFPVYLADLAALLARLDVESVDWLGTSLGGLLGMMIAAQPATPIRRFITNDAGPFLPKAAMQRIGAYVGLDPSFPSIEAMEAALKQIYSMLGPMTDAQMRAMTVHSARKKPDGSYGFAYDPHLGDPFRAGPIEDTDLWPIWDAIKCPTLVIRGGNSDVLTRDVADAMTQRGAKAKLIEFAGIGHAPLLNNDAQIGAVRDFLLN
jgi:pimeloyl-ACP methyl ester carboxylesterase